MLIARARTCFSGLALVFLYSAAFRLAVLDRPFDYDAEGTLAAQYGMLARSYLEFGWHQAHGMPVLTVGHFPTAPIVSYPDHPPFIPAVILPFYAAFGVGEWQTRLPISILTLAAIFVLYRLLAVTAGHRAGLTAAAVFAGSPMILKFGGMPEVIGTPLILFVLLAVLTYRRFHGDPRVSTFAFFLAAFALAGLCDWPAFVMVPVFAAHFVMTKPRTEWRWIVTFGAGACALFVAVYAYVALATHSPWYWMLQLLGRHSSVAGGQGFTLTEWLAAAYGLNRMLHTLVLLVPSGLWLMLFGFRVRHSQPGAAVARLLLAWGALCILAANKTAYSHEFMWIVLTPGIAVSTALLVEWLFQASAQRGVFGPMATLAALGLTMFASWTAYATLRTLLPRDATGSIHADGNGTGHQGRCARAWRPGARCRERRRARRADVVLRG